MKALLLKFLYVVAAARYPRIRPDLRYFVRDNYFARLNQIRFLGRDYGRKLPYKVIDYHGEFDQELRYVLPFAYWHFLNGTLKQTIGCTNTKPFYFFSPSHLETYTERVWQTGYGYYDVPNMTHSPTFDFSKWVRVPFREHYQNDRFRYPKPTLVVANKYNVEWDGPPVNFLSINVLDQIITACRGRYQIVYNRPLSTQIVGDNSETLDLHEHAWLRQHHPDVLLMNDLYEQHRESVGNYNQFQLMVYANCRHFISMHGGTAALASYFGGTNIILSKPGGGKEHDFNEYETIFPALSGASIRHAKTPDEVVRYVREVFCAG